MVAVQPNSPPKNAVVAAGSGVPRSTQHGVPCLYDVMFMRTPLTHDPYTVFARGGRGCRLLSRVRAKRVRRHENWVGDYARLQWAHKHCRSSNRLTLRL